jgi:serine/threonine protein kinase
MALSNYTIKHPIGQGGMAVVYLAEHNILQKPVAIKMLNKEFVHNDNIRKRFLAEAKNLFGMSHPNIIKVTDLIDEGDTVAFVMEYIQGESLKEYLNNKGKLSEDKIKDIFSQMLDGVGYVHEQNLVHRDIKPSNFMISQNGQIKLLDFGIAKNTDKQSSDYTQTGTAQSMGTPMYMSPEQVKSTKDVTLKSDIYSLGVVLWQMVMGVKPYDTNTTSTFELQTKIVTEKLRLTGTSFDTIIEVATAKEINNRYKNCKEIKSKLDNLHKQDSDNTKVYTAQESEKTIVDNTSERTEIESASGNKSFSKPNVSQPYVPIPPNKPKTSPVLFIVLGFVIIVILGIIISNNNSYTPDPYDYTADSTAVVADTTAIDSAAVDSAIVLESKSVSFENNSSKTAYLAYAFYNNGWETIGWIEVLPNDSSTIDLPDTFSENSIYWFAENSDGEKWEGKDGYFCVSHPNAFHNYTTENCSEQAGFIKLDLTGSFTTQELVD